MDLHQHLPHLMPALRETAAQTAPRLRRRLAERWPSRQFTVRSDAFTQTVTVTWSHGLAIDVVDQLTRPHCRLGSPARGTLWASPQGTISVVLPQATICLVHLTAPAAPQSPRGDRR